MSDNITGKDILLVIEPFYGYGELMEKELLNLGAHSVYRKVAEGFPPSLKQQLSLQNLKTHFRHPFIRRRVTENFKHEIANKHFDILLVVQDMPFTKDFLSFITDHNPGIRKILFLWDVFRTRIVRNYDYLPLFDTVYSFDRDDARTYNLRYYPDFYIDKPLIPLSECKYDLSFVGSMNYKDTLYRGEALIKINEICKRLRLNTYFYLRHPKFSWYTRFLPWRWSLYNLIKQLKSLGITEEYSIPLEDCNNAQSKSKVFLDLSYKDRQGMTINAITALALGKKLITTNYRIVDEDFYDKDLIYVIDPDNPVIPRSFLDNNYTSANLVHLRLDNWLKHIVNEEQ